MVLNQPFKNQFLKTIPPAATTDPAAGLSFSTQTQLNEKGIGITADHVSHPTKSREYQQIIHFSPSIKKKTSGRDFHFLFKKNIFKGHSLSDEFYIELNLNPKL